MLIVPENTPLTKGVVANLQRLHRHAKSCERNRANGPAIKCNNILSHFDLSYSILGV
jgi:hypothetical protein